MDYEEKTKSELISELKSLKSKLKNLENKQSEGESNNAAALMTNVINSTTDLIFAKDMKLRTIMCNKAFADAAGKKPEEMIGKTDIENGWDPELVHGNPEKGIRGFENDDWQVLKGNEVHNPMEPANVENVIRYFDTQKLPLRDTDGRIFGILGISRDVTECIRAEEELKKIFDLSYDMICIADLATGYFKKINPAFGKTLGYSDEELLGKPFIDFVHPDDRNPTINIVEEMLSRGADVINFENRYCCKDGSYKWLMWTARTIPGQEVSYAIARDITEGKLVNEELKKHRNHLEEQVAERTIELTTTNKKLQFEIAERKKSDDRLEAIIDNSTAVIYVKDIHGHYIMINRLYETQHNISRKEIVGKTDYDIFPEELAEAFRKNDRKVLTLKRPLEFEEIAPHEDGLHTYISLKFPLSNTENVIYGVCGISTDITERKKMEKELIKIQKLESVGMLAGGIAHDFNNSLQAILGYISLAKIRTNPNDEIYEFLEEANKAILQSRDLTQQLLTFSKGGIPVRKTIAISELLESSTKLALSGSNVRCKFIMPDGLWQIEADWGQLNQVISNLIINADQAMPEGGNIKIQAENINIAEQNLLLLQEGRYVKITVKDHGTGILQEHLQKVFDPYFTTKRKGSGLGLATAYSIVKKHDGHITVESETGVGTTFHIHLPASQNNIPKKPDTRKTDDSDNKHLAKKETGKPAASKGRVLVMDDEHAVRTILCKHIRILNYEVEAAGEGSEAIRLFEGARGTGKPFDAVILDLTVPGGIGGKETIKKLFEIDPDVRAIVSSGYANDPIMANYPEYGFKGVLVKPHEVHELEEELQKVITMAK